MADPRDPNIDSDSLEQRRIAAALFSALEANDEERVVALWPSCDPNARNASRETPLIAAARLGRPRLVEALLARSDPDAFPDALTEEPVKKAIGHAIASGNVECVRLLAPVSDLDTALVYDGFGGGFIDSALGLAAGQDNIEILEALAQYADPLEVTDRDWTPVHGAAYAGNTEGLRVLLGAAEKRHGSAWPRLMQRLVSTKPGEPPRLSDDSPLICAAREGHLDCAAILLPHSQPWMRRQYGESALATAAESGNAPIVALLTNECPANQLDAYQGDALRVAARNGQMDCVRLLIDAMGPERAQQQAQRALAAAIFNGCDEAVDALIAFGDPEARDDTGLTPLMQAANRGQLACVRRLLPFSDAEAVNAQGRTALMIAAHENRTACVEVLARHSDPDRVDARGESALMIAARQGAAGCVAALAPCCDVEQRRPDGRTPLMIAAKRGNAASVAALLPYADAGARDREGKSALMLAASYGRGACVEALAPASEINARDRRGRTALMFAARSGVSECITPLLAVNSRLDMADRDGRTALRYALDEGSAPGIDLLAARSPLAQAHGALDRIGAKALPETARRVERVLALDDDALVAEQAFTPRTQWAPPPTPGASAVPATARAPVNPAALDPLPDAKATDAYGKTALMRAIESDDLARVKALIPLSDLRAKDDMGMTPLMIAAARGRDECVQALAPVSNPNSRDRRHGWTALMFAAANGHTGCVQTLATCTDPRALVHQDHISHEADAIRLAVDSGHASCVKALLPVSDLSRRDGNGQTLLDRAIMRVARDREGAVAVFDALLPAMLSEVNHTDDEGDTPTVIAAEYQLPEIAGRLILVSDLSASIRQDRLPEISVLSGSLPPKMLSELLQAKLDQTPVGEKRDALLSTFMSTAQEAADGGDSKTLGLLKPYLKPDDESGAQRTLLHRAIQSGSAECVRLLLQQPNPANALTSTPEGLSPMQLALRMQSPAIVDALGPFVTAEDRQTALTYFTRDQLPMTAVVDERDQLNDVLADAAECAAARASVEAQAEAAPAQAAQASEATSSKPSDIGHASSTAFTASRATASETPSSRAEKSAASAASAARPATRPLPKKGSMRL